jgi:hypothetical protein
MKTYRSPGSPFIERPFFSDPEIDQICEDALREVGILPRVPEAIRIERFIEKRFSVSPSYDDLPQGVLGYTNFSADGIESIHVSRALADEGTIGAEHRVSTTLAHEAGHCLMHTHLFALKEANLQLFDGDPDVSPTKVLCRDGQRATRPGYGGRWWELQANKAIGALLIPRSLISILLAAFLIKLGRFESVIIDPARREDAVRTLANAFAVNRVVARIRLDGLYPEDGRQLHL